MHLHRGRVPLPALPDAGQAPVHTGEAQQEYEHQRDRGNNQAQHVGRGGVPLVGGQREEFIPAVDVAVRSADQQGQLAELGLVGGGSRHDSSEGVGGRPVLSMEQLADRHCFKIKGNATVREIIFAPCGAMQRFLASLCFDRDTKQQRWRGLTHAETEQAAHNSVHKTTCCKHKNISHTNSTEKSDD